MPISKGNNFKLIKKHIKHGEWDLLIIKGMNIILQGSSVIFSCSTLQLNLVTDAITVKKMASV